jgi:LmbE family N-acetylglucosaminyl deacetylase
VVVAAYPLAAEVEVGGLLLALAEAAIPATIVVLAPRLLPGSDLSDAAPERALAALNESAQAFGADIEPLDFSQQTIRDDPVAVAQLGQILRRRRPRNLITHSRLSPNPDYAAAHAISWRAAVLARSGGGLIAGAPLEQALEFWSFGEPEPALPRVRHKVSNFAKRKFELLSRLKRQLGDPFPELERLTRARDRTDSGQSEDLFLVGIPW